MTKFVQSKRRNRGEKAAHLTVTFDAKGEKSLRESVERACAGDPAECRYWLDELRSRGVNVREPEINLCRVAESDAPASKQESEEQ